MDVECTSQQVSESEQNDTEILKEEIRAIHLRYPALPSYLQKMLREREALNRQYLLTRKEDKKIEYCHVFEAVENELRLHQYRVYREQHPGLPVSLEEQKLEKGLSEYIKELIKVNETNRLCYKTTRDASYKLKYEGTKSAIKILVDALDNRWGYDIVVGLGNKTLKLTFDD